MPKKLEYKYVSDYFKEQGCELLEDKYVNSITKMMYMCSCGNISEITFGNFQAGKKCMECSGNKKFTFKYVFNFFKDRDCDLLETEYEGIKTLMKYKCKCGNIDKIRFDDFKRGSFCHNCAIKKRAGVNHYNYNPNLTDEERIINETRIHKPEYRRWRKGVFKKDDYCCKKCSTRGCRLNAHHIKNWASYIRGRYKISNGTTFCENCHNEFHSTYGKKNNNEEQINEFVSSFVIGDQSGIF